ncbi:MAG TPA: site-2 protease family protein [Gemmataceae bacterium]|nr:site-2 protease family protein [Gemmataceae bacterium]
MFLEPNETPLDLKWRMFGIPVRVHPLFWLVAVGMGWNMVELGIAYLLIWVACVFVSILVHEMGHVVMAKLFGARGYIILYAFGGLACDLGQYLNRWKRIAIALAGPGAGFLLYGAVYGLDSLIDWRAQFAAASGKYLFFAIQDLEWINLAWGLMNLLPVWPLDGGHVSRDLWTWVLPRNGVRYSLIMSIIVAALVAVNALLDHFKGWHIPYIPSGGWYVGILFAVLGINNIIQLQFESSRRKHSRWGGSDDDGDRMPWERDPDWWKKG